MLLYSAEFTERWQSPVCPRAGVVLCARRSAVFWKRDFFGGGEKRESTEPMIKFSIEAFSG